MSKKAFKVKEIIYKKLHEKSMTQNQKDNDNFVNI